MNQTRWNEIGDLRWSVAGKTTTASLNRSIGFDDREALRRLQEVLPSIEALHLDFAKVESFETSGIGLLVLLAEKCEALGVRLEFDSIPDWLLRVFVIARLHDRLDIPVPSERRDLVDRYGRGG